MMLTTKFMTSYLLMAVMVLNTSGLLDQSVEEQRQQQQQQVGMIRDSANYDLLPTKVRQSLKIAKNIKKNYGHDQKEKSKRNRVQPPTQFNKPTTLWPQSFHPEQNNSMLRTQYYAYPEGEKHAANTNNALHIKREDDPEDEDEGRHKINKSIDQSQEENYDLDIHNNGHKADANININDKNYHKGIHHKDDDALSKKRETNEDLFEEKLISENNAQQQSPTMHEIRSFHDIYKRVPAGPRGRALFGHVENRSQLFEKRFESQNPGNRYRGEVFWINKLTGDYGEHRWDLVQGKL